MSFERPHETISWAKEAIDDFDREVRTFFNGNATEYVIDVDPRTGDNIHKIRLKQPLPGRLSRFANDALSHTRNAFDQTIHGACLSLGIKKSTSPHFPWRSNPTDLEKTFENGKIPDSLWDVIRQQEPYPTGEGYTGGDDAMREVSKIAKWKHNVGLSVDVQAGSAMAPGVTGRVSRYITPPLIWDNVNNELPILIVNPEAKLDGRYQVGLLIVFDVPGVLEKKSANSLMRLFVEKAQRFLEETEAAVRV
ncbi:hypothetical protein J7426_14255 [Tropicibacter sp. R16_0]|uniref:hypothetical protein n=1 Tax=Tropicibacter sp. R16_0 TaxID=2821102 RepID=UPI001AD9B4EC|nr:hypothetical protein [Tropicibacter sp. R16_0]MBO9451432.1 hypothetical protein [Tropicibacter sp. R16_0]